MRRPTLVLAAIAVVILAWLSWRMLWPSDEQRIHRRLQAFAADFNAGTTEGLGTVTRAAKIGSYFTDDIVVDLGPGTPPIHGRDTLAGMAARLQPRTAAFTVELVDITPVVHDDGTADVSLTTAFKRQSLATGEESIDARELALKMKKVGGEWRVMRVTAVSAFR